jgi:hypothetical protein
MAWGEHVCGAVLQKLKGSRKENKKVSAFAEKEQSSAKYTEYSSNV